MADKPISDAEYGAIIGWYKCKRPGCGCGNRKFHPITAKKADEKNQDQTLPNLQIEAE
ncbi:MAG: hypothetical protein K2W95_15450 [Candidatus Obscuribacterales bacterium]|nr:hypothetical protein [Candidatus Obscuribacterales bacterium]